MIFSTSSLEPALAMSMPPVARHFAPRNYEGVVFNILLQICCMAFNVLVNFFKRCRVVDVDDKHILVIS